MRGVLLTAYPGRHSARVGSTSRADGSTLVSLNGSRAEPLKDKQRLGVGFDTRN